MKREIQALLCLLMLTTGGCAKGPPAVTFKIVDSVSGNPLHEVQCNRRSLPKFEPGTPVTERSYPPTASDGLLVINDLPSRHRSHFYFSKPGYELLQLTIGPHWDHVLFAPTQDTPTKEEADVVFAEGRQVPLAHPVIVPMRRTHPPAE